jgi:elongation factor G
MASHTVEQLRNVALIGHGGSGKTSLAEAMVYASGGTTRLGRVEDGTTVSDYDPEEIRRKISVNLSIIPCEWEGCKINVLDTPGYADFVGEVKCALAAADAAVIVLHAVAGVEVGTEMVWGYADERNLPRLVFVNMLDRENANFAQALERLRAVFPGNFLPFQWPIGSQQDFRGVVDLVTMRAYLGSKGEEASIPPELQALATERHQQLVEAAAESDDELIMKYLDGGELTAEEMQRGLRTSIIRGKIIPVLCGAATANLGTQAFLHALIAYLPSPADRPPVVATLKQGGTEELRADPTGPLATLAFKTIADPFVGKLTYLRVFSGTLQADSRVVNARTGEEERIGTLFRLRGKEQTPVKELMAGDVGAVAKLSTTVTGDTLCDKGHPLEVPRISFPIPVYSAAVKPKTKTDVDKLGPALQRLIEEDPTLQVRTEPSTHEIILSGMGDNHIAIAARKLSQKFGVEITTDVPKVPYQETITKTVQAHGRHKKQTGGRGQFGDVYIRFEPLPRGAGFEFVDEIFGGAVPNQYIPAVEKGLREIMQTGVLAGYPTVDFRAALYDGGYHPVDSSELAFKLAAHLAFKEGIPNAGPVLLEPIMNVRIIVPEEYTGDIMSDLNTRRGRVQGMEQQKGKSVITAQVPLAEMQRYANDLRGITQGRGFYTMEFSHYDVVPSHIAEQVIAQAKREQEAEKA